MAQQHMTIEVPMISSKAQLKAALEKGLAHIGEVTIHKNGRLNIVAGEASRAAFSTMDIDGKICRQENKFTVDLEAESKLSGSGWAVSVFCFPFGLLSLMQPKRSIGMLKKVCRDAGHAMCNVAEGLEPLEPKHASVRYKRRIITASVIGFVALANILPLVPYAAMPHEDYVKNVKEDTRESVHAAARASNEKHRLAKALAYARSQKTYTTEQMLDVAIREYNHLGGSDPYNARKILSRTIKGSQALQAYAEAARLGKIAH
jgi:hypothetical protein